MTINVTYEPSEHHAEMFWWRNNRLMGIVEWSDEDELDIDPDHLAEQMNDNYEGNYE